MTPGPLDLTDAVSVHDEASGSSFVGTSRQSARLGASRESQSTDATTSGKRQGSLKRGTSSLMKRASMVNRRRCSAFTFEEDELTRMRVRVEAFTDVSYIGKYGIHRQT